MSSEFSNLFAKYNVPGPRYTSYPTVPYWETTPTPDQWLKSLQESLIKPDAHAALYIHVPFCQSLCTYCGCNTRITKNHSVSEPYIQTVLKEWQLYLEKLEIQKFPLFELHLGGGTPTFLSPSELSTLLHCILKRCQAPNGFEYSIEADPRVTTREQLEVLRDFGFRRLSLGIQDFDPKVQQIVNRIQTFEQVQKVVEDARDLGFTSINFDLIYGLPFQTAESVRTTLSCVEKLRPDRIAFYAYAHVPWIKPSQRRFTEDDLPSGQAKRKLYEIGRELLEKCGYFEIGMDHFSLESDSLFEASQKRTLHRNFMGYISRHVSPLIGLGVSAIGDSWQAFIQNEKNLETYTVRVEKGEIPIQRGHLLTKEDLFLRQQILNLMTRFETDTSSSDFQLKLDERLLEFEKDGLVKKTGSIIEVRSPGKAFLRNICMAFDARLYRSAPTTRLFSQTL